MTRALRSAAMVIGLVSLAAATSCRDTSPSVAPTRSTSPPPGSPTAPPPSEHKPACVNEAAAVADGGLRQPPSLAGDVDGDGVGDDIHVVFDPAGPRGCRAFLVAETARATLSLALDRFDPSFGLPYPRLKSLAEIDGVPGLDVVADVGAGASTQWAAVFTFAGGSPRQLEFEGSGPNSAFGYGGSVGHLEAADCVGDGSIVVSFAAPSGKRYELTRSFYEVEDAVLIPISEEKVRLRIRDINDYPEYAAGLFGNCPVDSP